MDAAKIKAYRDYEKKSNLEGTHHKLIYGCRISEEEWETGNITVGDIFKQYSLYLYGYESGNDIFIGFEYGRIECLYDHLHFCYSGDLQFTSCQVPYEIEVMFKETYPKLIGSRHALIQNVRTHHYTNASVIYGYWIQSKGVEEWADTISDLCDNDLEYGMTFKRPGHNMTELSGDNVGISSNFIIGIVVSNLAYCEDTEQLASDLQQIYRCSDVDLPSRDVILSILHKIHPSIQITLLPMLCLVQNMCYCCT